MKLSYMESKICGKVAMGLSVTNRGFEIMPEKAKKEKIIFELHL